MRTKSKPNCRAGQLGPRDILFTRRYQKLITHLFMRGIFGSVKGNDSVPKHKTGVTQYTGGTFAMAQVVGRGDV